MPVAVLWLLPFGFCATPAQGIHDSSIGQEAGDMSKARLTALQTFTPAVAMTPWPLSRL